MFDGGADCSHEGQEKRRGVNAAIVKPRSKVRQPQGLPQSAMVKATAITEQCANNSRNSPVIKKNPQTTQNK